MSAEAELGCERERGTEPINDSVKAKRRLYAAVESVAKTRAMLRWVKDRLGGEGLALDEAIHESGLLYKKVCALYDAHTGRTYKPRSKELT